MARRFTSASSERVIIEDANMQFTNWGFGTLAAYVRKVTDIADFQYILSNSSATADTDGFGFALTTTDTLNLWSLTAGLDRSSAATLKATDGWAIVSMTKATGGTPRAHFYKQSAASPWTHQNTGGTSANNTSIEATPRIAIGAFNVDAAVGTPFNGHIAAILAISNRAMTDSEIERLPRGRWDQWLARADDFLIEFPSGRDPVVSGTATVRSIGRSTMKATSTTGTSVSDVTDPPGFKFSRFTRRR